MTNPTADLPAAPGPVPVPAHIPLRAFIASLDPNLGARQMYRAARAAGYETTMASIHTARTSLGIAQSRKSQGKAARPRPAATPACLPPITEFPLPTDEAILEHLIVKVGIDRAQEVFDRVKQLPDRLALD